MLNACNDNAFIYFRVWFVIQNPYLNLTLSREFQVFMILPAQSDNKPHF